MVTLPAKTMNQRKKEELIRSTASESRVIALGEMGRAVSPMSRQAKLRRHATCYSARTTSASTTIGRRQLPRNRQDTNTDRYHADRSAAAP